MRPASRRGIVAAVASVLRQCAADRSCVGAVVFSRFPPPCRPNAACECCGSPVAEARSSAAVRGFGAGVLPSIVRARTSRWFKNMCVYIRNQFGSSRWLRFGDPHLFVASTYCGGPMIQELLVAVPPIDAIQVAAAAATARNMVAMGKRLDIVDKS